jgi:hypothetical protein
MNRRAGATLALRTSFGAEGAMFRESPALRRERST